MQKILGWLAFSASVLSLNAVASNDYQIDTVLIPDDQTASTGMQQTQVYKPHEVAIDQRPLWVSSNERGGFAGITLFRKKSNDVIALVNIEEPGLDFTEETEEETIDEAVVEEIPEPNFPGEIRFNPSVCLPVKLYPGSTPPVTVEVDEITGEETSYTPSLWEADPSYLCAPLGAEGHARHPHGIDIDKRRKLVYQVIEHSGLRWNRQRNGFEIALTTDEESGMLLVYDISRPKEPQIVDGFLLGHGAHELAVNERNGKVFQGNHEDSPGVEPNIWVDVIDRNRNNPYGFIDTGFYNAIQGIEVDEQLNVVFGTTHVGERMFTFSGNCNPRRNRPPTIVDYNLDPAVYEPFVEKAMGENCILYNVDLRAPFLVQIANAQALFDLADTAITEAIAADEEPTDLPSVLHTHDLTVDGQNHRVYQTVHGIHHAEHTGSPEEAVLPVVEEAIEEESPADEEAPVVEEEAEMDIMGRWIAEVDVDPKSKTFKQVRYIDLSNGWDALAYPGTEDLPEGTPFDEMFIHAHWVAADPKRETILVTGEHTGNLGVVEVDRNPQKAAELEQVIGISLTIPECVPPLDESGVPTVEEPHVHGVQIDPQNGRAYVSDEGEHCFYESVTVLEPVKD